MAREVTRDPGLQFEPFPGHWHFVVTYPAGWVSFFFPATGGQQRATRHLKIALGGVLVPELKELTGDDALRG